MRLLSTLLAVVLLASACTSNTGNAPSPSSSTEPVGQEPTATTSPPDPEQPAIPSYAGTVPAPEFPGDLDWLNTATPIRLDNLEGKIVVLDFWTYGCINCIHIIPDLERLEEEYAAELVVIGVHSAKFANESATENIRQVVLRYGIEHPVVNDHDFAVWQNWGAQAWPTIALIDPAGNVVGTHAGEGVYDTLQPVIEALVAEFADDIDRTPLEFDPESATQANTILSYPGKVATTATGETIFVADTGHHRIISADAKTGEIAAVYGNGKAGFESGPALSAQFNAPQGLAYDDDTGILYIADTDNHAIRTVDTATGAVETLAGNGQLGWPPAAGLLDDIRLNSPWGLALHEGRLWIAMAGFHQIWSIDLLGGTATPAVGSAREGVANGPLTEAELAQPSGLVFDDRGRLYFADSESSSIRWADALAAEGTTGVLAGTDVNLFDFGDEDGVGTAARLQHPLGVVWDPVAGELLVADTYNSKIKRINTETGATETFLGSGHGWADGDNALFYEPGGLAISERNLYVADTNNHVIRTVNLDTGEAGTLVLHGIEQFSPPPDNTAYSGTIVEVDPVEVGAGDGFVELAIELPADHKINEDAPSSVDFHVTGGVAVFADGETQSLTGTKLPRDVLATFIPGEGVITADLTLLYCRDDAEGLCVIEQVRFVQPIVVGGADSGPVSLSHVVTLPDF